MTILPNLSIHRCLSLMLADTNSPELSPLLPPSGSPSFTQHTFSLSHTQHPASAPFCSCRQKPARRGWAVMLPFTYSPWDIQVGFFPCGTACLSKQSPSEPHMCLHAAGMGGGLQGSLESNWEDSFLLHPPARLRGASAEVEASGLFPPPPPAAEAQTPGLGSEAELMFNNQEHFFSCHPPNLSSDLSKWVRRRQS